MIKDFNTYISEGLFDRNQSEFVIAKDDKGNVRQLTVSPKNIAELRKIIRDEIDKYGVHCDLNFIDISKITDLSHLFSRTDSIYKTYEFDGDISKWDVGHVDTFDYMFFESDFTGEDGDISNWRIKNGATGNCMFCLNNSYVAEYEDELDTTTHVLEHIQKKINSHFFHYTKLPDGNKIYTSLDDANVNKLLAGFYNDDYITYFESGRRQWRCEIHVDKGDIDNIAQILYNELGSKANIVTDKEIDAMFECIENIFNNTDPSTYYVHRNEYRLPDSWGGNEYNESNYVLELTHNTYYIDWEWEDESDYDSAIRLGQEDFEEKFGERFLMAGRGGKHICVANSWENLLRYEEMKEWVEEWQKKNPEEMYQESVYLKHSD